MDYVPATSNWFAKWMKNLKLEVGLHVIMVVSVSIIITLFCIGGIWTGALKTTQPSLVDVSIPSHTKSFPTNITMPIEAVYYKGGTEAVHGFRTHLKCFSESGKWVHDPKPRHLPWNYVGDTFASTCDARHQWTGPGHVSGDMADDIAVTGAMEDWLVREELKWVWQTNSSCPWQSIDRDDFCKKIGSNRQVMLVGDSLNHEISWSLMNALIINGSRYKHLSSQTRSIQGPFEMCSDIFGPGKGFMVSFVRNDRLSPIVDAKVDTWNNFYEFPWMNLLEEYNVKILILNRGAHYEDDEIYTEALRKIFTILSLQYPHIQVIFRNTQPGHMNCMNFTQPLSKPQVDFPPNWHWRDFDRQNLLAKHIVEEFEYIYMDVSTMLSLRPEGHIYEKDCLHYCIPGPLDLAIEYLYNILLLV